MRGEGDAPPDLGATLDRLYNPLIRRICRLERPVVCAVNGVAAGAGANLAFNCDIVLAARSAKFMEPFCKLGLVPDAGGTYILPRLVGAARARGLALLGETLTAEQAEAWGLIWRVVDDERLMDEAQRARPPSRDPADQRPGTDQAGAPGVGDQLPGRPAGSRARPAARSGPDRGLSRGGGRVHGEAPGDVQGTLMAALAPSVPVAVIGAGTMGAGIAQVAAAAGHPVLLYDAEPSALGVAKERIAGALARAVERERLTPDERDRTLGRIAACDEPRCAGAGRPRDRGDRRRSGGQACACSGLWRWSAGARRSSRATPRRCRSRRSPPGCKQPERMVGMHFFNPAPVMALVEVVRGLASAPEAVETVRATAAAWGKTPVVCRSTPGFIVNRVARPFYGEALRALAEGAADVADHRCGDARRRRVPHGAVRADRPDRPGREPGGQPLDPRRVFRRSALHAIVAAAGAGRGRLPRAEERPRLLRPCAPTPSVPRPAPRRRRRRRR